MKGGRNNPQPTFNRHATASQSQSCRNRFQITFQPPEAARRTIPRLASTHDTTILRVEPKSYSRSRIPCPAKYTQTYTSRIRPSSKARVREMNVLWVKARTDTETLIGYGTPTVITLNGCPDERSWFVIATKWSRIARQSLFVVHDRTWFAYSRRLELKSYPGSAATNTSSSALASGHSRRFA